MKRSEKKKPKPQTAPAPPLPRCAVCANDADSKCTPGLCTIHAAALLSRSTKPPIVALRERVALALEWR